MILAVAIAIGALLTWMLQRPTALLAVRIGAVSRIRSDRWSHPAPLQRLAGLAFSIPAIACCIWVSYNALALSLAFLVLLGMIDDAKELKPAVKFLGQIVAVLPYTLLSGSFSMQPVLLFWLLLHINAANMFDNMDGSLALVAAICLIGSGAMLYAYSPSAVFAFALAGGLLCFLRINWHPAKAFMGDTGSMVVGMVLGILSLELILTTNNLLRATLPAGLILLDSVRVCITRMLTRTPIWVGGLDHLTHRLATRGHTPQKIAISFAFVTAVLSLAALAME